MKIKIEDADQVPEGMRNLVRDGELDLMALAPVEQVKTFKQKALDAAAEAKAQREALSGFKAIAESPDEIAKRLSDLETKAKSGGNEDHAKIVADMKAAHDAALAEARGKASSVIRDMQTANLKAELAKAGVVAEGLDLLASFAASRIKVGDDGSMSILTADGKSPMIGAGSDGGATLADLASEIAKGNPRLVQDAGQGGGGKASTVSTGGKPKTITRQQFDALSNLERRDFAKEGGRIT